MPRKVKKTKAPPKPKRGERIYFIKCTYAGENGWLDESREATADSVTVILDFGQDSTEDVNFKTMVRRSSVTPSNDPENIEEFVVLNDPNVSKHLAGFAKGIAEAGLDGASPELLGIVKAFVDKAVAQQLAKGTRGKYSASAMVVWSLRKKQEGTEKASATEGTKVSEKLTPWKKALATHASARKRGGSVDKTMEDVEPGK